MLACYCLSDVSGKRDGFDSSLLSNKREIEERVCKNYISVISCINCVKDSPLLFSKALQKASPVDVGYALFGASKPRNCYLFLVVIVFDLKFLVC